MYGRKPPRSMCEYIVGRRIPRPAIRQPSPSPPESSPHAPKPAAAKLADDSKTKIPSCSCCNHRPGSRCRFPRKQVHVTDFDTSSDESSGGESIKVARKDTELKSALKKPSKEEPPKKTLPEVCKTTKREPSACECVYCLRALLNQVKIDIEKKQNQKKHVSFENRYVLFPSQKDTFTLNCVGEFKTDLQ